MDKYKLIFSLEYKFLCWGIPESNLSGKFKQEINVDGGCDFKLRYQRNSVFKVSAVLFDNSGAYVVLTCPEKQLTLRLNRPVSFNYKEEFEQFTDCNTGVYEGSVTLEKI